MNIKNFRKNPLVIKAIQLTWENWSEICDFIPPNYFGKGVYIYPDDTYGDTPCGLDKIGLIIHTLEGDHLAIQNDWIVKGIMGEINSVKPDIFNLTYEEEEDIG